METATIETEAAIAEVRRRQVHVAARDIVGWLAGIVSSVETGQVHRGDLGMVHRELTDVERLLEELTNAVVLHR